MLLTKTVIMKWNVSNRDHYINKGYVFTKIKDEFEVKVEDLSKESNVDLDVRCDCEQCENPLLSVKWYNYKRHVSNEGKYYCLPCAAKLYRGESMRVLKLKKGRSFEDWCIENNRYDILDRWDYKLNKYKPNEIGYGSNKKIYFKCPNGKHPSEPKNIKSLTGGISSISCNMCNSFAQWGIDKYGEDFLEKYWDYEKNNILEIDPWRISYGSNKKVWIKCQVKDYHESNKINCGSFIRGDKCPYCTNRNGKVHKFDSLGILFPETLSIWSSKNKKSTYEYAPFSNQKVYWKCSDNKHEDYYRSISNSNLCNFRCPECQYSKGEEYISNYLINNYWTKVSQDEFDNTIYKISNKYYIPQKEFEGLVGTYNGNLSYDFYLPQYNLLIEFQGEQHERYIPGFHNSIEYFEKQVEHDRRKREYAERHEIELLEIWYYDFNNIDNILDECLLKEVK